MKNINITQGKQIALDGDFNSIFDSNLETNGRKPQEKKNLLREW